jgi:hypothetical protein
MSRVARHIVQAVVLTGTRRSRSGAATSPPSPRLVRPGPWPVAPGDSPAAKADGVVYGRSFRCQLQQVASIEANLSVSNMDYFEFADVADKNGGLFTGFR